MRTEDQRLRAADTLELGANRERDAFAARVASHEPVVLAEPPVEPPVDASHVD